MPIGSIQYERNADRVGYFQHYERCTRPGNPVDVDRQLTVRTQDEIERQQWKGLLDLPQPRDLVAELHQEESKQSQGSDPTQLRGCPLG